MLRIIGSLKDNNREMGICSSRPEESFESHHFAAPSLMLVCDQSDLLTSHPSTLKSLHYSKFSLRERSSPFCFSIPNSVLEEKIEVE